MIIQAGLSAFAWSRLHRLCAPVTRGRGAILTFHHVRPWAGDAFAPNRLLEITPDFFDRLLTHLADTGRRVVPLDAVPALLDDKGGSPFVVLTFDDGYRDNVEVALPIIERHKAPFTLFATTGFLDRQAPLWWVDLEDALRRLAYVEIGTGRKRLTFVTGTTAQKSRAFQAIVQTLDRQSDSERGRAIETLCAAAGVDSQARVDGLCLDWAGLKTLAAHPLATIGCHTRSHPRLARGSRLDVIREIGGSRDLLAARLGQPIRHLAYPFGDPTAAGPREFELARELGFETAVTTRPGLLFPEHRHHLTGLPRVSMNGLWQTTEMADILLSGAALALWNGGRRLNVV